MTDVNIRKIRKIYGICMAVYSAIVGILFIIQVWTIYRSTPNNPYTAQSISAAFSKIAVPVWIWVAAVLGGAFIPKTAAEKPKASISSQLQIARLRKRVVLNDEDERGLKGLWHFRVGAYCALAIVWVALAVVGVCMLTDSSYQPKFDVAFFKEHNALVDRIVCILPWLIGALLVSIVVTVAVERSRILEVILLKEALKKQAEQKDIQLIEQKQEACPIQRACGKFAFLKRLKTPKAVMITRICLGVIGVVFVVFGIFNGGMNDVLEKAIKICTQCIGLG